MASAIVLAEGWWTVGEARTEGIYIFCAQRDVTTWTNDRDADKRKPSLIGCYF